MKFIKNNLLNKLKQKETEIKELTEEDLQKIKMNSMQIKLVLKVYGIAGHKTKPKQIIEFIKNNKLKEKKSDCIKKLSTLMNDWQQKINIQKNDKDFKTTNWKSKHKYDNETIQYFLSNMFFLVSNNHLLFADNKFSEIQVKDFEEYLDRYNAWEKEIVVSANKN